MERQDNDNELIERLDSDESSFSVQNTISFVWRLKWWIILFLTVSLVSAFFYSKLQIPIYSCGEKVMFIDDKSGSVELSLLADVTGKSQNRRIDDEIIIIKSPSLMTKVVKNLDLNTRYYQYKLPVFHTSFPLFRSIFNILEHEFYKDAPFKMSLHFNPLYSSASLPQYISVVFNAVDVNTYKLMEISIDDAKDEYEGGKLYHYGDTLVFNGVNVVIENPDSYSMIAGDTYKAVYQSPEIVGEEFSWMLSVSLERGFSSSLTNIMNLTFIDNKPQRAVDILNTLIKEYNFEAREYKSVTAVKSLDFISERIGDISKELGHVESEYRDYQTEYDYIEAAPAGNLPGNDFEQQLIDIKMQRTYLTMLKEEIEKMADGEYKILPANIGVTDGGINEAVNQYNTLITEKERLAANSASNNPRILKYNDQIKIAKNNIEAGIHSLEKVFQLREGELSTLESDAKRERSFIPTRQLDLAQISRKQQIVEPIYLQLNQRREEIQLSMFTITDNVRVIETAKTTPLPLSPDKKRIYLIAVLIGIGLPIGFVLLRNVLRTKVETKEDIKKFTKKAILAVIPQGKDSQVISSLNIRDYLVEAFRMLRSNMQYVQGKVIQVTSSIPGEGKSFVAVNLAISLSHLKKKVALVGLDLRHPVMRKMLPDMQQGDDNIAVVSYLIGKHDVKTHRPMVFDNNGYQFDVYFPGHVPPNPTELLAQDRLKDLFDFLRENYDYVICDSTPFFNVSDAILVNKYVDMTLYVVRADHTPLKLLRDAAELFKAEKLKNVNIVLNGLNLRSSKYRYGYGYGYGYGSDAESDETDDAHKHHHKHGKHGAKKQ